MDYEMNYNDPADEQEELSNIITLTDADGKEFYQNAGDEAANGYIGYYNTAPEAYEENCHQALAILEKHYAPGK